MVSDWTIAEKELGLNFIEIMEGNVSEYFHSPLKWTDMVKLMGNHGLRGPDAMVLNLFTNSRFPLLITTDSDFEFCLDDQFLTAKDRAVFHLA